MGHSSIDRHVDSDTRFSRGMWELKKGVSIDWATDVVKTDTRNSELYFVSATHPIRNRGDQLNIPTVTTRVFSPREGIIGVEAYHFRSAYQNSKEPKFELESQKDVKIKTSQNSDSNVVTVDGDIAAKVLKKSFGIDFVGEKDKVLTRLGRRSLGYVKDTRYPQGSTVSKAFSPYMTAQLHLSVGEKIYGLGERFGPFLKNGQKVEIWNEDGGTSSEWAYKNIPFYISNRGYGVLVDSSSNVTFEVQSERTTRVNIAVPGEGIRFYIINGPDYKTILKRYAQLTGFPALPPAWSFGLWLTTSFTTDYDMKTVSSFIKGMHDRDIPLSCFHFDCFWMKGFQWCDFEFDPDYFPDPKKMLSDLKKEFGVKICLWINPYIAQESSIFDEADKNGYLIRTVDHSTYQIDLWQAGMGIVDFTNPKAVKWYQDQLSTLIDMGVDCFKTDFGERIPCKDVKYYSGQDPVAMHNYYTLLYNRAVFEILESKKGKHEAALFARSATVGGQKFPVHWGGDVESTFEGMAETLRGGLSFNLSGFGFWAHDIGGFEGTPDPAIYKRWCAFGLLSSHSRLHGSASYRVPWNFDDESSIVLSKFTKLKISLMPYLYHSAIQVHKDAIPMLRAMFLEFPDDPTASNLDTQYMLGENFLVAPVFSESEVSYYIPKGNWYGLLDGKVRSSEGKWVTENHDFKSLPLLVRPNSVFITSSPESNDDNPDFAWNENFTVNVYEVDGDVLTRIPNNKKPGEYIAEVKVKSAADGLEVSVSGSFSKPYFVKLINSEGKKYKLSSRAEIFGKDEFGNILVKVNDSNVKISEIN